MQEVSTRLGVCGQGETTRTRDEGVHYAWTCPLLDEIGRGTLKGVPCGSGTLTVEGGVAEHDDRNPQGLPDVIIRSPFSRGEFSGWLCRACPLAQGGLLKFLKTRGSWDKLVQEGRGEGLNISR